MMEDWHLLAVDWSVFIFSALLIYNYSHISFLHLAVFTGLYFWFSKRNSLGQIRDLKMKQAILPAQSHIMYLFLKEGPHSLEVHGVHPMLGLNDK